jgi:murein DD-endopeptidase MepM/ murein hydrolase activator NlpD
VARFGTQQNPVLRTVTKNTGIDIALPAGTPVASVADGEVSTIWWLPSFGNLVIVSHSDGFRTVYAHMSEIFVNEGDAVSEGRTIGKSGEALSGPMLHFEIWKDRDNQDPEAWLRPRGVSAR